MAPAARARSATGGRTRAIRRITRKGSVEVGNRTGRSGTKARGRPAAGAAPGTGAGTGPAGTKDKTPGTTVGRAPRVISRLNPWPVGTGLHHGTASPLGGPSPVLVPHPRHLEPSPHIPCGLALALSGKVQLRLPVSSSRRFRSTPGTGLISGSNGVESARCLGLAIGLMTLSLSTTKPLRLFKRSTWRTSCGSGKNAPGGTLHRLMRVDAACGDLGTAGTATGLMADAWHAHVAEGAPWCLALPDPHPCAKAGLPSLWVLTGPSYCVSPTSCLFPHSHGPLLQLIRGSSPPLASGSMSILRAATRPVGRLGCASTLLYKVVSIALTVWAVWDPAVPGGGQWVGSPMVLNRPFLADVSDGPLVGN